VADAAPERDANTVRDYTDSFENHVLPALGHVKRACTGSASRSSSWTSAGPATRRTLSG